MNEKKLSARKLAKETGISPSSLSEILRGADPSLRTVKTLAAYFGVSLDRLVNDDEPVVTFRGDDFTEIFSGIVRITVEKYRGARKNSDKKDKG